MKLLGEIVLLKFFNHMKNLFVILMTLFTLDLNAQNTYVISGIVLEKTTGDTVIGAVVTIPELKGVGTISGVQGTFRFKLSQGHYTVQANMMGYKPYRTSIMLSAPTRITVYLEEEQSLLKEAVIVAAKSNPLQASVGTERIDMKQINKIPVLMGEKDVLKSIQFLPGVKGAGDGNSGFYVRGGSGDQNLVLLDDAPVYNATHLFGMFSTFNSDAVKGATLYKGGMPAQFGGRLSSTLQIDLKEGDPEKHSVFGSVGMIASKLGVEGPLVHNKGAFILAARRTYADLFLKFSSNEELNSKQLYFYDMNGKISYPLSDKTHLSISGYTGKDQLRLDKSLGMNWGNSVGTIRVNHMLRKRLTSQTAYIYSLYDYKIALEINHAGIALESRIRTHGLKQDFKFIPTDQQIVQIGFAINHHTFLPGQVTTDAEAFNKPVKISHKYALENGVYMNHDWTLNDQLSLSYGIRFSLFSTLGRGPFPIYDASGQIKTIKNISEHGILKTYLNPEPRISLNYSLSKNHVIKTAYSRNVQNIHLVSGSTAENPSDIWLPSSLNIKPEKSDQLSMGFMNTINSGYEVAFETYYKAFWNLIDYRNGASIIANELVESELLYGNGRAYGFEILLKKKTGRFNGWIAYTLSRTERKFQGINQGNWFPSRQDRTHDISIVGIFDIDKNWSLSATWVYNTGNAVTFPTGKYPIDGKVHFVYSERNGERMPDYHRMDIGVTWNSRKTDHYESSWNFSVYNVYGRDNAYRISFEPDAQNPSRTQVIQTTLFSVIPAVTYNFRFL